MAEIKNTLAHQWFELVWNQGRVDMIDQLLAPEAIAHGLVDPAGNPVRGPAGFKPFHQAFRQAFPDIRIEIEDAVSEADLIAVRCVVRGTHHGEGLGIAPTRRPVEFTGMCFMRVRDGKLVEAWNNFDFEKMRAQLG